MRQTHQQANMGEVIPERLPELAKRRSKHLQKETLITLIGFGVAWQIASYFTPDYVIPGWGAIWESLQNLQADWIAVTTGRVFLSLFISFLLGTLLALIMYLWQSFEDYSIPLVKLIMAVPVICWILFAVLWFRGVEFRIAFVLIVVCAPIFLIDLLDGMKGISKEWRDMVRSLRPTRLQFFRKLILPAILPVILTSWKVNLSLAIRVVTIAELVGSTSGIGYGLVVAQGLFSISNIFAWTVVLIGILLLSQQGVSFLESRYLQWREVT